MSRAALIVVLVLCAAIVRAESKRPPALGVFLRLDEPHSERLLTSMKKEVEKILRPTTIRIEWRTSELPPDESGWPDLVVVRFRGNCKAARPVVFNELGPYSDAVGLGSTNITDGEVFSYGEVLCDSVRQLIDPISRGASRGKQEELLGRGLGRVLAHELRHMLLKQANHSHQGIAKSAHSARDLVSAEFGFNDGDLSELQLRWQALTRGEPGAPQP
jgi:hypothetical protein